MHLQTNKEGGDPSETVRSTKKRNPRCLLKGEGTSETIAAVRVSSKARKMQTPRTLKKVSCAQLWFIRRDWASLNLESRIQVAEEACGYISSGGKNGPHQSLQKRYACQEPQLMFEESTEANKSGSVEKFPSIGFR